MVKKGRRYKVKNDSNGFFAPGVIVVALEDSAKPYNIPSIPYCVFADAYEDGKETEDYDCILYNPVREEDLEEV